MSIVNFAINTSLEEKIKVRIKEDGFASKAEFFRFLAITYIDNKKPKLLTEGNTKIARLVDSIKKSTHNIDLDALPSLEEQLAIINKENK